MRTNGGFTLIECLVVCAVLALILCFMIPVFRSASQFGLAKYTRFTELPSPSNSYEVGQIVQIYSEPRMIEIVYQPDIPLDLQIVSPGWNISGDQIMEKIKSNLAAEISNVLHETYEYASKEAIKIQLINPKTREIPKGYIYNTLKKDIENDVNGVKALLKYYIEAGNEFDVVTKTLSANISLGFVDPNGQEVAIDPEVIKELNSELNMDFKQESGTNQAITGNDLVIGICYDLQMVAIILGNP